MIAGVGIASGAMRRSGRRAAWISMCALFVAGSLHAQVTGGQFAFEFLRLSNSPHVSAMGGINVASPGNDISLAFQNPALMRPGLHNQLQLNYNGLYAGVSSTNMLYGYHVEKLNTSFMFGVQYLDYGDITKTSSLGAIEGSFKAIDYATTFGASRSYGRHWRYGAAFKFAHSALYTQRATAAMLDVGVNYYDTATLWDIGVTAKNMGVMLDKYTPENPAEPIPFDLQFGLSKRFKHVPLRLFTTIHHLYEWDVRYDNPADRTTNTLLGTVDSNQAEPSYFSDKLFRHFIFGAEITLGKRIVVTGSFNYLRRKELVMESLPGLTGFSFGVSLLLNKFDIRYGRSYYSVAGPYNEIGLSMRLNRLFGLGPLGHKIHWNENYEDWNQ